MGNRGFFEKATKKIKRGMKTIKVAPKHRENALKAKRTKKARDFVKGKGQFKSDAQRQGFFGKVDQVKRSDRRSKRAKAQDARLKAKKVHPFNKKGIKKWRRSPNTSDLKYVDTPTIVRRAKVAKTRAKIAKREAKRAKEKRVEVEIIVKRKLRIRRKRRKPIKRKKLTGVEIEQLKRLADNVGVPRDEFDFTALIDRDLTFHENKANLEPLVRLQARTIKFEDETERFEGELKSYISELEIRLDNAETLGERAELVGQIKALKEARGVA